MKKYSKNGFNTESFIKKSKEKHGDKFDYSLSNYTRATDKIKIRCIKHDLVFETEPPAIIKVY